ncbi:MAG: hypothetical protein ABIQ95_08445 [Bdellovibrionia bacterium]
MKKNLTILFIAAAFASSAFAESAKSVTATNQGAVESSASASHNPLTDNDTVKGETVTKDGAGNKTSVRKYKVKRDHKTGEVIQKNVESKKMDASGNVIDEHSADYKN